jgi:serine protease Do
MVIRFANRRTKKMKTSSFVVVAAASLLLMSAPGVTRAQAPAPGFPPPGFGGFARPAEPAAGWLGVAISEVTAAKAKDLKVPQAEGAAIDQVGENSPAAKAGLQKDDVVTEFNGQHVEGTLEFERFVRETPPGRTAKLSVWRSGKNQPISVVMGDLAQSGNGAQNAFRFRGQPQGANGVPAPQPGVLALPNFQGQGGGFQGREQTPAPSLGVAAQDLSGQLGNYFGAPDGQGVLVTDVHMGSAGEKAGLKAGDVITKVDGERVRNVEELRAQLRAKRDAAMVTLGVIRKGSEMSVTATPEKPQSRRGSGDHLIPL